MELEKQVCSLELAKRLKELGVKQESIHGWRNTRPAAPLPVFWHILSSRASEEWVGENSAAAFTVAELGEMLPEEIMDDEDGTTLPLYHYRRGLFYTAYRHELEDGNWHTAEVEEANTEADARAKMLIYLLENNLLPQT